MMLKQLKQIAEQNSIPYNDTTIPLLLDIYKLIEEPDNSPLFNLDAAIATYTRKQQGDKAIEIFVEQQLAPPKEREYKIKRSKKGTRIDIADEHGVRYSFGPVWNDAIEIAALTGKGLAMKEMYRNKLVHQAFLLGVLDAKHMASKELCKIVADSFGDDID
jgi:hypothetical protein